MRNNPNLADSSVKLEGDDNDAQPEIPGEALRVLAEIGERQRSDDRAVHAELTSQQAADLLNVSRPYLVKLLEEDESRSDVPATGAGCCQNRLLAFKRIDDRERHAIADKLTAEAELLGLEY